MAADASLECTKQEAGWTSDQQLRSFMDEKSLERRRNQNERERDYIKDIAQQIANKGWAVTRQAAEGTVMDMMEAYDPNYTKQKNVVYWHENNKAQHDKMKKYILENYGKKKK